MHDGPQWFAVHARSRHEKSVHAHLVQRAVESFLPAYRSLRVWRDRRVQVELPLFPGYLFVRIGPTQHSLVVQTPGVVRLVGNGRPMPVDPQQIEAIRAGLLQGRVEPHPYLAAGERVIIDRGPFAGVEGVLETRRNACLVIVSIAAIMQSIAIEVRVDDLEPLRRSSFVPAERTRDPYRRLNTRSA